MNHNMNETADAVQVEAMSNGHCDNVLVQSACLEHEWRKMAVQLGDLCDGNRYIEYNKEIARLNLKLVQLQEELDGFKSQNENLSTLNTSLVDKVKDLISVQDSQLEQYSTALVLLTDERRELWHSLGASQKKLKGLEEKLNECRCVGEKQGLNRTEDVGVNTDPVTVAADIVHSQERNIDEEIREIDRISPSRSLFNSRNLCSLESSILSSAASSVKNTPAANKSKTGSFVNSMVEKLEKKRHLKSFDEPVYEEEAIDAHELVEVGSCNPLVSEYQSQIEELEQQVSHLRETCVSLSGLLERTYEEMQASSSDSKDDAKDQLISCLRSRLLEAICDLMKLEKQSQKSYTSVACGSSFLRGDSAPDLNQIPSSRSGESVPSPSKSRTSRILMSPASKLKALGEDNYNRLKKLNCWKPKSK